MDDKKNNFALNPYVSTTDVQTYLDVFMINSSFYEKLPMPKGLGSIYDLPVELVNVKF